MSERGPSSPVAAVGDFADATAQLNDPRFRASLIGGIRAAHATTRRLCEQLEDEQLFGPKLQVVNPPVWEVGHISWFYERWVLRHVAGRGPVLDTSDGLYDSMAVDHELRWDLMLPDRRQAYVYADSVCDQVIELLESHPEHARLAYHAFYSLLHEDMHAEAFAYSRQTLGWPSPRLAAKDAPNLDQDGDGLAAVGDLQLAGGTFRLGAEPGTRFVFDNEKWAHEVTVEPFAIARVPVTESMFADFVDAGGYRDQRLWSEAGWTWRQRQATEQPVYWRRDGDGWQCRVYDRWRPIAHEMPIMHVSWFEADAFCRWAGRRLPTEVEWELAASADASGQAEVASHALPWGDEPSMEGRANVGGRHGGPVSIVTFSAGDSAGGARQMIGNVWEWTASAFEPFPGFQPDPYADYSAPWFGDRQVLRGGSWASQGRMLRNTLRNFFPPERRDVFAGFRTCAR